MNIEEIEEGLPNGFHDATLKRLNIDYAKHVAELDFIVYYGYDEKIYPTSTRKGRLTLSNFVFCSIEPPVKYSRADIIDDFVDDDGGPETTSCGPVEEMKDNKLSPEFLAMLPDRISVFFFFFSEWNANLYVAYRGARWVWLEEAKEI